jgi:hypothetical protein
MEKKNQNVDRPRNDILSFTLAKVLLRGVAIKKTMRGDLLQSL